MDSRFQQTQNMQVITFKPYYRYYAYGQPQNPVLRRKKKKKRHNILDNPTPVLQQYTLNLQQLGKNVSQTLASTTQNFNKTPKIPSSNKAKLNDNYHNSSHPNHNMNIQQLPEIIQSNIQLANLQSQKQQMLQNSAVYFNNQLDDDAYNQQFQEQRIEQLLKEQKMIKTRGSFFNNQQLQQQQFLSGGSNNQYNDYKPIVKINRELANNNSQVINMSDFGIEFSQERNKNLKNSFNEVQHSIDHKTSDDAVNQSVQLQSQNKLQINHQNSLRKQQNGDKLTENSPRQNPPIDYKLPQIRSNDSINRLDDQSRLTTLQNKQSQNFDSNSQIVEESKNILMMANRTKNMVKKFVGHQQRAAQSKDINEVKSNRNTQAFFNNNERIFTRDYMPGIQLQNQTNHIVKQAVKIDDPALILTDEEKQIYGNRFPSGYKRIKLLGRGGCALVWLAKDEKNGDRQVAVKQFPKAGGQQANLESGYKELQMNRRFFQYNGVPYDAYSQNPGISSLCKLFDSKDDKQDLWLVFELCGKPLSKTMFDVKGEFYKGERIYQVLHKEDLYRALQINKGSVFKEFIKGMAQVLYMFQSAGIVHSDLKPENILIIHDLDTDEVSFKIIDLGSSFNFQKANNDIELTTPEYLAPDILEYLDQKTGMVLSGNGQNAQAVDLTKKLFPWSIDIWSLGAILLEIVIGFPLWLSYKGRIVKEGRQQDSASSSLCMTGLFGIQGRIPKKIKLKQIQTVQQLKQILKKQFSSDLCLGSFNTNEDFLDLLAKMLDLNPKFRISPKEILEHPFLQLQDQQ
ncbi:protein kinase domain containing protein [Stylonychia lemnae]|uniref:Protein kinase domain containing protein n=1 Tax=Stylonychia lemnae TaxID=5949 RepID=A0A078B0S2_STYLE|nr:protein kinase domain containing protein [Stylonychia lemnae]|eukprot:CDW87876.1 protein kinase domain containing protein [Stylonychia lemnae]